MKPDEYVLVRHRCPPYKGKLKMDYKSDFGFGVGADLYGKDVVYPQREMEEVKTFSIKDYVKEKKQSENPNMGMPGMSGNRGGFPPIPGFPRNPSPNGMFNPEQNIDELIKSIDKQIAALEAEEKANKEKEEREKFNIENNKEVKDIKPIEKSITEEIKPVIEDKTVIPEVKETIETKDVTPDGENAPKVSEVVHSNMVNLENFTLKDDNVMEKKDTEIPTSIDKDDSNYDDFFDDFFDE